MNYDDEMLREINEKADLLSYAQNIFEFKQSGDNFFTHCPSHIDITPSLAFNAEGNYYHCFSCGKSGGMIGFLMDFEGLDFESAVKKAASLAKIDLGKMCQSRTVTFLRKWREVLLSQREKKNFEHQILPVEILNQFSREEVREWLEEGIEQKVMDIFDIRVDNIGNRIVYPVYDIDKHLINIKGRTRYENYKKLKLPKYINYYKVGVMDYFQCLETTLPYVKEKDEIIIFESIKSVMKAYGWGYRNCVSAETHTLSAEQISLLARLNMKNIVFAYDSDVSYWDKKVRDNIDILRRLTNVYIIEDRQKLLGGAESKNAPADCGKEIWKELYQNKRKVV